MLGEIKRFIINVNLKKYPRSISRAISEYIRYIRAISRLFETVTLNTQPEF